MALSNTAIPKYKGDMIRLYASILPNSIIME